jgi:uncharacterized protein (TIGR03083 family)
MMDLITAERRKLAEVLGGLSAAQWQAPSLCAGWTTAHVVAHLTMPFRISEREFALGMQVLVSLWGRCARVKIAVRRASVRAGCRAVARLRGGVAGSGCGMAWVLAGC